MEEHILLLGRGLVHQGYSVAAICSTREEIHPLRDSLATEGIRVHGLDERAGSRLGGLQRLQALRRTLRQYPGCILHLHLTGHHGGDLIQLAGRLAGVRAMVRTEHLPPVLPITALDRARVRLRDLALAKIICVSEQTRQLHLERLGRDAGRCTVVPNCVDLERFSPTLREYGVHAEFGFEPTAPIIGTVSRLGEHRKGIHHFLDMAADVAALNPTVRFLVVGDGELRSDLEQQARRLGIQSSVVFTGERRDIPRLLAAMRIFVMPSLYEGGPYTILEAMAMEKPVVATPVGLVSDVVDHRTTGLLVPIADSAALTEAVVELLSDAELPRGLAEQGRQAVVERFSLDAMIAGVTAVYREVA